MSKFSLDFDAIIADPLEIGRLRFAASLPKGWRQPNVYPQTPVLAAIAVQRAKITSWIKPLEASHE